MFDNSPSSSSNTIWLKFFDVLAAIHSDSPAFIRFFRAMYERFLSEPDSMVGLPVREYALYTQSGNPWGKPVLVLDGAVWPLNDDGVLQGYAYDGILNAILARVRSHLLIHSGALSLENRGIALIAEASYGKTTLTLELVRRKFRFLSDELAAVSRADHRLYAFPRRLRVRPETLDLLGLSDRAVGMPFYYDKYLLDIEAIHAGAMVDSSPLHTIFILSGGSSSSPRIGEMAEGEFGVYVDRIDDGLLSVVSSIPGVSKVRQITELGYPVLRVVAENKLSAINAIERLCDQYGIHVLQVSKRVPPPADFSGPAKLVPLSRSQAVMEVLRQYQPGRQSSILQDEYGGSATRLFIELANALDNVECYRLDAGPLEEMADLVCSVTRG